MTIAQTTSSYSPSQSPQEIGREDARRSQSTSLPEAQRLWEEKSLQRIRAISPLRFYLKMWLLRVLGVLGRMEARL
jgi:hypothetical protein